MGKITTVLGNIVVGLVALGVLANLHDIERYIRMSTM
jgi:hypothetical protein